MPYMPYMPYMPHEMRVGLRDGVSVWFVSISNTCDLNSITVVQCQQDVKTRRKEKEKENT